MANRSLFQVTLVVDDYDRAKAYYCDVLGFDLVEDKPMGEGKRWVIVRPGKEGAAIVLAKATTDAQTTAIGNQTGGRVGFFLATDDFSRDHKSFLEKGVKFREQPRTMPYGTVAVFEDLYGNTWDFIEPVKSG
ncbi:lactoylglutathione lyase [Nemania sp. FL0031]|nr:lactoylglutathione lyase [Nemania sp. FL0031]